jgi:hypothetical protein
MDLLRMARNPSSKLRADPRRHNAICCACGPVISLEAAAVDSYHLLSWN